MKLIVLIESGIIERASHLESFMTPVALWLIEFVSFNKSLEMNEKGFLFLICSVSILSARSVSISILL